MHPQLRRVMRTTRDPTKLKVESTTNACDSGSGEHKSLNVGSGHLFTSLGRPAMRASEGGGTELKASRTSASDYAGERFQKRPPGEVEAETTFLGAYSLLTAWWKYLTDVGGAPEPPEGIRRRTWSADLVDRRAPSAQRAFTISRHRKVTQAVARRRLSREM